MEKMFAVTRLKFLSAMIPLPSHSPIPLFLFLQFPCLVPTRFSTIRREKDAPFRRNYAISALITGVGSAFIRARRQAVSFAPVTSNLHKIGHYLLQPRNKETLRS